MISTVGMSILLCCDLRYIAAISAMVTTQPDGIAISGLPVFGILAAVMHGTWAFGCYLYYTILYYTTLLG